VKRLLLACALASSCGSASPAIPSPPAASASIAETTFSAADLAFCVADINRYRALANRPALAASAALDAYAAAGAQADAVAGSAHSHFIAGRGGGIAAAESELLTSPRSLYPTLQGAIASLDSIAWSEGPAGGHYQNLIGAYTQVGCGAYATANAVTIVQDFK
jgi:uncharacterized protein YkwD